MLKHLWLLPVLLLLGCNSNTKPTEAANLIFKNGNIYTANDAQPTAKVVAVTNGRISYVGDDESAIPTNAATQTINLNGQTLTPGLIEGHGHILGIGYNEMNIDLLNVSNYDELLELVAAAVKKAEPGQWIVGRGWHQSKWVPQPEILVKGFQTHERLSAITPNNPVLLRHASGHASFANAKAMEIAGVKPETVASLSATLKEGEGGEIIVDDQGVPTGILVERATGLIARYIPANDRAQDKQALVMAQEACLRLGITGFHDAGQNRQVIDLLQELRDENELSVRMYVMLTGFDEDLLNEWYQKGPMIDSTEHLLDIRSIKLNCDGALGSRGAWLLEPYSDRPDHYGHETLPMSFVESTSKKALQHGFQVCAHAIGDRANREILDRYEIAFNTYPDKTQDHRFRIEHAQHLNPSDIGRFAELGVIPAMQAIHMASDRPWAIDRLGEQRILEGAYVWQKLLQTGVKIVNGTDAPVEPLDPLPSFYASVSRRTLAGTPEGGYEPDQKMTREQALKSYTIWAAYGAFMENDKGSIEVGKLADFTVFDKDVMTIPEDDILNTTVRMTVIGGEIKYQAE
ncbi:amidohydrolase family protein [Paucihalobacter ruber]|uniref:Amidohydrolase family protein n=1 Tax=Paucihalobacter ruber TaxID=2567861 RepID=A0A506PT63_9FLAO|nr:amidohydrolase [Paucihalobacter ruber]TPV35420.1 amidohydrolase family protein [Paucihalobacter ruber]